MRSRMLRIPVPKGAVLRRRVVVFLLGLSTILGHAVLQPSAASAVTYSEWDQGVLTTVTYPSGMACTEHYNVNASGGIDAVACFEPYGDYFYVKDAKADSKSAAAYWVIMEGGGRTGACINSKGAGTWVRCNKNFIENKLLSLRAGTYNGSNGTISDSPSDTIWYRT